MEMLLKRALEARHTSPSPARILTAGYAPRCDTAADAVGSIPVLWIDRPLNPEGRGFWAKLEGRNPGGMKDRAALHMVDRARERGDLPPGGMIVESTSGTLGLGLALAGITYGHPVTLVTDPGLEPIMHRLLVAYGAQVDVIQVRTPSGAGRRPGCSGWASCWPSIPARLARISITTRTTWPGTRRWHGNSSPNWAGSTCWSARWALAVIQPA